MEENKKAAEGVQDLPHESRLLPSRSVMSAITSALGMMERAMNLKAVRVLEGVFPIT